MSRTIEELRAIGERAEATLIRVYELYSMGDPPILTPGIVEAVLEAAAQQPVREAEEWETVPEPTPSYYIQRGWEPPQPAAIPQPQSKIVLAPSDDLESAVIARLRELAVDGIMPTQAEWNAKRGDLPNAALLYENWGRRHWAEWAELAGLAYAGPRNSGKRKTRKTEAPAPTPEAAFRGAQVSDNVARYAVNGAPARD
jgi:hypothetical protein